MLPFLFYFLPLGFFFSFLVFFFGLPALGRFAARWFKNSCSTDEIMYTTPCPPNFCPLKVFFFFGSGTGLEPIFTLMARQLSNKNKNRAAPITRIGDLDPDLDVDADNLAAACGNQESLAVSETSGKFRRHFVHVFPTHRVCLLASVCLGHTNNLVTGKKDETCEKRKKHLHFLLLCKWQLPIFFFWFLLHSLRILLGGSVSIRKMCQLK